MQKQSDLNHLSFAANSQSAICKNVNVRTIQSWEARTRAPTHSALRLLEIIDKGIYQPKIHRKHS